MTATPTGELLYPLPPPEEPPAADCTRPPESESERAYWLASCERECTALQGPSRSIDVSPFPVPADAVILAANAAVAADPAAPAALRAVGVVVDAEQLWPHGGVPYEFGAYGGADPAIAAAWTTTKDRFRAAVTEWNAQFPNLFWVEIEGPTWRFGMNPQEREAFMQSPWGVYVDISTDTESFGSATVGYRPGGLYRDKRRQTLRLAPLQVAAAVLAVSKAKIKHEMLHSIGFNHEHVNRLRDRVIYYISECVKEGYAGNFTIPANPPIRNTGPVDFDSVMLYPSTAFNDSTKLTAGTRPWNGGGRAAAACFATMLKADGTGALLRERNPMNGNLYPVPFPAQRNGLSPTDVLRAMNAYPLRLPFVQLYRAVGNPGAERYVWGTWQEAKTHCTDRIGFRSLTAAELGNAAMQRLLAAVVPAAGQGQVRCIWAGDAPVGGNGRRLNLTTRNVEAAAEGGQCVRACTISSLQL